jgi:hypothetical protein
MATEPETAQATGVVALLEYNLSARIARVYAAQSTGVSATPAKSARSGHISRGSWLICLSRPTDG